MKRREFILLSATAMVAGTLATRPFAAHAQNSVSGYPDHPVGFGGPIDRDGKGRCFFGHDRAR